MRRTNRVARALAALALATTAVAGTERANAATVNGGSNSGEPGQTVAITFTLLGNGTTRSIGAVYNLPSELSFSGGASGGNPPFQCTLGGIAWTNTGSPIPANAGTCSYNVLIAANATPGVKQITLTQASCDDVCTLNPAQITVTSPASPPSIAYAPATGSTVALAGGPGTIGSQATATITATSSGGSGSGPAATTTVGSCSYTGSAAFGTPPGALTFTASSPGPQSLPLACTRTGATESATLSCSETAGAGAPVARSWNVTCPAGVAGAVPPTLGWTPAPGSVVAFSGGNGAPGTSASASVVATPSGGSGSGAGATTTVTSCAIGGADAASFTLAATSLSFVGAQTASQAIGMTCVRGTGVRTATLSCVETAGAGGGVNRSWPLSCPAGTQAQPSSVSLSVAPSRITQSATVTLEWTPVNATSCVVASDRIGTVITPQGNNRATAAVSADGTPRNEVFTVSCNGGSGTVANSAVLSVGVPPPPPAPPVASVAATGTGGAPANGASANAALSDGGRFVVFESTATNLAPGDSNNVLDVYRRDRTTGALRRVSVPGGALNDGPSGNARVSRDGNVVLFTQGTAVVAGTAGGKTLFQNGQVCLNNLATNATECVSKNPNGTPGNGSSNNGALSGDGNVVVYESTSTNISPLDTNGAVPDVYAYTRSTNRVELLSLDANGASTSNPSTAPAVSCNGRHFAFETRGALVNGPIQPGVRNIVAAGAGPKRLASIGTGNAAANGDSGAPRITDDGRYVFFESLASNLVPGDTNGTSDVFVADLVAGGVRRVSVGAGGAQGNGASRNVRIACDGAYASFQSSATNLVAGDANARDDVFVVNMGTAAIALASQAGGAAVDGNSGNIDLSPDGTSFGFDSSGGNLGGNGQTGVFAGTNPFAQQNFTGAWFDPAQAGHGLFLNHLADGRLVAWWFTFDPSGAQAWFGGVGQAQGTNAVVSIVRTEGARFLPNFQASDAQNTPIGTLTFNFTACDRGRVDYALAAPFGNGFMNLSRLTTPTTVACGGAPGSAPKRIDATAHVADIAATARAVEPTVGPIAGVTGAWYDPAQPGHGLFIENLGDRRLIAYWFTFGPSGGQAWFGNVANIVDGNRATIDFIRTQGGRWIPAFNPANVTNPVLGTATIRFDNCDAGTIVYDLQQGYGSGTMILRPLLRPIGSLCGN